jgi:hypothetical protein
VRSVPAGAEAKLVGPWNLFKATWLTLAGFCLFIASGTVIWSAEPADHTSGAPHVRIDQWITNGFFNINDVPDIDRPQVLHHQQLIYNDTQPHWLTNQTFRVIGGVLFKGQYLPGASSAPAAMELSESPGFDAIDYRRTAADGARFVLHYGGKDATVPLEDWLAVPIIRYANSDTNAIVTLFANYDSPVADQLRLLRMAQNVCNCAHAYFVALHPAFLNTRAGMLLLYSDIIPINENFRIPPTLNQKSLGPTGVDFNDTASSDAYQRFEDIITSTPFVSYINSDPKILYRATIKQDRVNLNEKPRYYFWNDFGLSGDEIQMNEEVNSTLREHQNELLLSINAPVYETVYQVARWSSVFRFIKDTHPEAWRSFLSSIADLQPARDVETPVIYGPKPRVD